MKKKTKFNYIYVCYPITQVNDGSSGLTGVYDYEQAESFTTIKKAERFLKDNYAQYIMTIEYADTDLIKEIKKYDTYIKRG
jgi:hypothetical protein